MNYKGLIACLVLLSLLAALYIFKPPKKEAYVHATVISEFGTIVDNNEAANRTYGIKFKTDDGKKYTFSVKESFLNPQLEKLASDIEWKTRIKIKEQAFNNDLKGNVGSVMDSDIEVLK